MKQLVSIFIFLTLLSAVATQHVRAQSSCGNAVCESGENASSCQLDCGQRHVVHLQLSEWGSHTIRYGDLDKDGNDEIITVQAKPIPLSTTCGNVEAIEGAWG